MSKTAPSKNTKIRFSAECRNECGWLILDLPAKEVADSPEDKRVRCTECGKITPVEDTS